MLRRQPLHLPGHDVLAQDRHLVQLDTYLLRRDVPECTTLGRVLPCRKGQNRTPLRLPPPPRCSRPARCLGHVHSEPFVWLVECEQIVCDFGSQFLDAATLPLWCIAISVILIIVAILLIKVWFIVHIAKLLLYLYVVIEAVCGVGVSIWSLTLLVRTLAT